MIVQLSAKSSEVYTLVIDRQFDHRLFCHNHREATIEFFMMPNSTVDLCSIGPAMQPAV